MKHKLKNIAIRFNRQRPLILLFAIFTSAMLVVGSTYAWFTQSDHVANTLQTKTLSFQLELNEQFNSPDGVTPGQQVTKVVNITNTGDIKGFVRVMVRTDITASDGSPLAAIPGVTFTYDGLNVTDWSAGNTKLWADGGDGYYYYLGALDPGQTTAQPLFSSVTLASNLGSEYDDAVLNVQVKIDAVSTQKWEYRSAWWNNANPPAAPLNLIDDTLASLAL